jgi:putative membrane protein
MSDESRKPKAFRLTPDDEPAAPQPQRQPATSGKPSARPNPSASKSARRPRALPAPEIEFDEEPEDQPLVPAVARTHALPPRFKWGGILLSGALGLATMWAGLAATQLIEDLFARNQVLGWIGTGFLALVLLAALAIMVREIAGLMRVRKLGTTQDDAARAISANDAKAASTTLADLNDIYAGRADMRWGMAQLKQHGQAIMDPADRIRLAERDLMVPLDAEASRIIARTARRVSVITAVAPAALDIVLVGAQNLKMMRELATLYGGRPGTLGTMRLARMVAGHLAVTGGLAMSDSVISHLIGKGLIGRLSARFGEGAVNGILTARIGLAAMDLCRPLPFLTQSRPGLSDFMREVVKFGDGTPQDEEKPEKK